MLQTIEITISQLLPSSTSIEITAVLEQIAYSNPDPIALDQHLRRIAKATGSGMKPIRQSYDIILKKLNIKPVDLGLAMAKDLLATKYNDGLHLRRTSDGVFYFFDKSHWKHQPKDKIRAELQTIAIECKGQTDKPLHAMVSDALGSLSDYLGVGHDVMSLTDEPLAVINCLNGELWLDPFGNTELRPHRPESQMRYCLPYDYDPAATCQVFDHTIHEICSAAVQPEELVRHVMEMMGYAIQPRRPIPCFWLLIGHGANGKTKLMQTFSRLISPDYLYNVDMTAFKMDRFGISQLPGKLVLIDDDLKMDCKLPDGLLKKISESKLLSARVPYGKESFNFLNSAMPIMVGNHYPACDDLSQGLLRRAMVVPFKKQFLPHEQDSTLFDMIWQSEMSGVLNRAIEGYKRIIKRGIAFDPPEECLQARQDFLAHGNPLYCFLQEKVEKAEGQRVLLAELRTAYEAWAKQQNISNMSVLDKTLKRKLQALGYEVGVYNGYNCIIGHMLK